MQAQSVFRNGMVTDRTLRGDRRTSGRGSRLTGVSAPSRQPPSACPRRGSLESTLAPGIDVVDAANRLAFFDWPTFFVFKGTTGSLRSPREQGVPLEELDPTCIFSAFADEATRSASFTSQGCPLEETAVGLRASISFIDLRERQIGNAQACCSRQIDYLLRLDVPNAWRGA